MKTLIHTELCAMSRAIGLVRDGAGFESRKSDSAFVPLAMVQLGVESRSLSTAPPSLSWADLSCRWESWELGVRTPLQLDFCTWVCLDHTDEFRGGREVGGDYGGNWL